MRPSSLTIALAAAGLLFLGLSGLTGTAQALTLDDVIRLKLAGIGEETILHVVDAEDAAFYLSVDDILDLREAGASDDFIRALLDTAQYGGDRPAYREEDRDDYGSDWSDDYALDDPYGFDEYTVIFTNYYYDPFTYYWHVWPRFYVYYSPFWWSHAGFYYAGFWCRDWWDPWSSCAWYCDWHYGYGHHFGRSHTRAQAGRTWHRVREASRQRFDRERSIYHRAGLGDPPQADVRVRRASTADRNTPRGSSPQGAQLSRRARNVPDTAPERIVVRSRDAAGRGAARNPASVRPTPDRSRRDRPASQRGTNPSSSPSQKPTYRRAPSAPAKPSSGASSGASSSSRSVSRSRGRTAQPSHSSSSPSASRARKR